MVSYIELWKNDACNTASFFYAVKHTAFHFCLFIQYLLEHGLSSQEPVALIILKAFFTSYVKISIFAKAEILHI